MSPKFEKIKRLYDSGLWTKAMVRAVVGKAITAEEYTLITGEEY